MNLLYISTVVGNPTLGANADSEGQISLRIDVRICPEDTFFHDMAHVISYFLNHQIKTKKYSQFSLSRSPRNSVKYFKISVPRQKRFAELRRT